jgi:DNA polymerase-3 subunit gamma/tau
LRDAASKKILIEVALLKAIEARNAISLDTVLNQLQSLREGNPETVVASPAITRPPVTKAKSLNADSTALDPLPAQPQTAPESLQLAQPIPIISPPSAGADLEQLWARVVEAVGRVSPFTRTYLLEAHPVSFAKNLFTIGFDPEVEDHLGLVDNSRNHAMLQTKLQELGHANVQIKFVKAEAPEGRRALPPTSKEPEPGPAAKAAPPAPTPKLPGSPVAVIKEKPTAIPFSKEDFKNDPLIQKALEIFKGQIVEVRA